MSSVQKAPRLRGANPKRPGQIGFWGTIPALIIGLLFTVGPLVIIFIFSFMSRPFSGGGVDYTFTLEPYITFLFQSDFGQRHL